MFRRFLVILIRRSFLVLLLICMGCVAQSSSPELERKIERQVRSLYSIPPEVHVLVAAPAPSSEWPGYDSVSVTIGNDDGKKQDYQFLVSKDRKSMMRLIKFDLTKDPYSEVMKKIDLTGRPTRGAKASKVVVVNFDDFECPYCSRMHQTLFPEIFKEYGDRVTFITRIILWRRFIPGQFMPPSMLTVWARRTRTPIGISQIIFMPTSAK